MKFADFVTAAGLAFYAEVALALFVIVFIGVVVNLAKASTGDDLERQRLLPLDDALPDIGSEESAQEIRRS